MKNLLKHIHKKKADALLARNEVQAAMEHYRKAGDSEGLARAALEAGDHQAAARFHMEQGDHEKAAEILFEGGDYFGALEIYRRYGMKEAMARVYEKMERYGSAAEIHLELGHVERAIAQYRAEGDIPGLILAYKKRGNVLGGAEECRQKGETLAAALLYELAGENARASDLFAELGMKDKALVLYEKIGNYSRIAEIHESEGRLSLAADAYDKAEGQALKAATLFSRLVLLQPRRSIETSSAVISGVVARNADAALLGTQDRSVAYVSRAMEVKWNYRISGSGHPNALSIASDGALAAVAAESVDPKDPHLLLLFRHDKEILWQQEFVEPVRDMVFLKDNSAMAFATGDWICLHDLQGKMQWKSQADFKPWTLALAPDGDHIVAGSLGGSIYRLDLAGKTIERVEMDDRVRALFYTPERENLVVTLGDGTIVLLDSDFGIQWEVSLPDSVRFVDILPRTNLLAVAGKTTLSLLDMKGDLIDSVRLDAKVASMFVDREREALYVSLGVPGFRQYGLQDCRKRGAECYERAGELGKAADLYFQVEEYPQAYELYKKIGDFEKAANTIHLTGDVQRAARHYEVIGLYEKAADLYAEIGQIQQAAKCYGKANLPLKAAELYERMGETILAADFYERAGEHKKAGLLFAGIDQRDRAIETLEQYLPTNPGDNHVVFSLGKLYFAAQRHDDAIRMYQGLTDKPEYSRDALIGLGQCFMEKGLHDVAIDRFNECLGEDTKPARKNLDIQYLIGCCHEKTGRFKEAKELFGKILAIDYYYKDIRERHEYSQEMSGVQERQKTSRQEVVPSNVTMPFLAVPESVRRYEIIKKLGEGGMGVVYLARDTKLNRQVAWKVLPAHLAASQDYQQRLLREARAAARLMHKHIVTIYDVVSDAHECSITMEYIDGVTLRGKLNDQARPPLPVCLRYAAQISDALRAAHKAGVIHRDVKPENIMITTTGDEVKMADFGLARLDEDVHLTREGCVVGTISYMAPEQIRGEEVDGRVDIYAFGGVLFEMVAGRTPYVGKNVLAQHLHNLPPSPRELRPEIPAGVEALILSCLEKDKDSRPANFDEVLKTLKSLGAAW